MYFITFAAAPLVKGLCNQIDKKEAKNLPKTFPGPMPSSAKKENLISSLVIGILSFRQNSLLL